MVELKNYKNIIGYGIGQYYDFVKEAIPDDIQVDFLSDMRWEDFGGTYNNIPVISPDRMAEIENAIVVVFSGNKRTSQSINSMLDKKGLPYIHVSQIIVTDISITGKELKERFGNGYYEDSLNNKIIFSEDIEESIVIHFLGRNNEIYIGNMVSSGPLSISCGNNGCCKIGANTEIESAKILVTNGTIEVGEYCLVSTGVVIRNHDSHHIFDKNTGKRINFAGNIHIGNHVWIGEGVTLLGSASIGDNSIVGTKAVTSASFPKEVIIAGNPAKVVREKVCWSKDSTEYYNRESLENCLAQEASLFFE